MVSSTRGHGVTIVARNYLPQARVLAASFLQHHREARFHTVVIDGDESDRIRADVGNVILPSDLGLPLAEWHAMAAIYTVMEFATAVKPAALRHLVNDGAHAVYLDPDIVVMAPLTDVFEALDDPASPICLTPHVLEPMPRDGLQPEEASIRHSGIFNLGFCAVAPAARPFLDWWHERLLTDGVVDLANALFTDQRWIDWVPALFPCKVLRDPGLNVAYWNLHERPLSVDAHGALFAGNHRVKFFHFSGYDPTSPTCLSKHAGARPRVRLDDDPVLQATTAAYGQQLIAHGFHDVRPPYRLDHSVEGHRLMPSLRAALRRQLTDTTQSLQQRIASLPDPFDPDRVDEFRTWLTATAIGPEAANITAWELEMWRGRNDLQHAFPHLESSGAFAFRHWLDHHNDAVDMREVRAGIGARWRPTTDGIRSLAQRDTVGWNLVGYLRSEHGVGEAARRLERAIDLVGLPVHRVAIDAPGSRHSHPDAGALSEARLRYRDSIYVINADQVPSVLRTLEHPGAVRGDARRIGVWFWEVNVFPSSFEHAFALLDEVWVTSEHTRAAIAPHSPVPVRVVPLPVEAPSPTASTRRLLGLPEGFCFAFSFDFHSVMDRKHPLAAVRAYTQAFHPLDGAHLIIKSINADAHPEQRDEVRAAITDRPDIHLIDGHWSAHEMSALLELVDCFVSLHRCEGFGLHLADAMAAGTPVIATGYSGNLAFMDRHSAALVPSRLVPVGAHRAPYPPTALWAEPDLPAAAAAMRTMFDHPEHAAALAATGRAHVLDRMSVSRALDAIRPTLLRVDHHDPAAWYPPHWNRPAS